MPRAGLACLAVLALVLALLSARRNAPWAGLVAAAGVVAPSDERARKPNRLIGQKSPYLLQHAMNPVDWRPWGDKAFRFAKQQDRPIFLSIGYSTCHWCHVMERESFEDDSVAALLNRWFVPIKVDREERPDVDRVYMTAMQAMGLGGGWPLNVFLTPDRKPFFGGTYFPPRASMGRPGLMELLPRIHEAWTTQRADLEKSGDQVIDALAALERSDRPAVALDSLTERAFRELAASNDPVHGGFGTRPKFPSTVNLDFLMRVAARDPMRREAAMSMVLGQLDAMRDGGIHDQIGGGFHRYSTDSVWLVPHFEKMLYDQALIAGAYLDAFQIAGRPADAATAREIFEYVARDLTAPDGGFDSAEDADSEGEEGKFYVWTRDELDRVLGASDARLVAERCGVTAAGNFEHGASILHRARPLEEVARELGLTPEEAERRWNSARARLLAARAKRVRPHRDDKIITAWNGLMIGALARGARVLDQPEYAARAARAAEFVWNRLRTADGGLHRRWRDGEAAEAGQLDDYAYYAHGLIELYQATFDPRWLERAVAVTQVEIERFWDPQHGAFYESPADPALEIRLKDGHDGAEVAGNSVAAWNLELLANLLDRRDWKEKAKRTFDYFGSRLEPYASAMPRMLVAMDLARGAPRHVVVAGDPAAADAHAMIRAFERRFMPHDLLLVVDQGERRQRLAKLAPFVASLEPLNGRATAFVCVDYACRLPTTDLKTFGAELDQAPSAVTAKESSR